MFSRIRYRISIKYILITTAVVAVVLGVLFFWISGRHTRLIIQQVEKQALILYRKIILTRQWVSDHSYVLVAAGNKNVCPPGEQPGQIQSMAGQAYTRITPAGLTRRLSRRAASNKMYAFNITSLGRLKGHSSPDEFEQRALVLFQNGRADSLKSIEVKDGEHVFRYAAPLLVRRSCLSCHDKGGLEIGGVGGCISVLIPFEDAYHAIHRERLVLFFAMSAMTVGIVAILFFFARQMIFNPIHRIKNLTARMRDEAFGDEAAMEGDELKEFAGLCYLMDKKLKSNHQELEKKIAEATRDLSHTNSELEKANRELQALNAARIDFFSDISHEIRTPLTSIKGAADILARKDSCSEPVYVDIIKKNTDHLIRTIVDFLDYAKIEAGRMELEQKETDLFQLTEEVIAARRPEALKKGIEIRLKHNGSPVIVVDRYRIYQVLSNLLVNAIKFSPGEGWIIVGIEDRGRVIQVCVTDQGPGIAPKYHQAVFDKFFQVPGRNAPDGMFKGSSGIGLAICRALVAAHDGKIWVESSPGCGSRFIFTLPKRQEGQEGDADAEKA